MNGATRQWRNAKSAAIKRHVVGNNAIAKQPPKVAKTQFDLAVEYISAFSTNLANYRPVDSKHCDDLEESEVIIPFESIVEFFR